MARAFHNLAPGRARMFGIADKRAPQIVKEQSRKVHISTSTVPCVPEIANRDGMPAPRHSKANAVAPFLPFLKLLA